MFITACLLIVLWLLISYIKLQRSLRWWHGQQSMHLCREAELIRDGLLQETFTLRRGLELSLAQHSEGLEAQHHLLTTFEKLHTSLKQLSDHLSPPYAEDSLPLAIQHLLEFWKSYQPTVKIEMNLPTDWQNDSYQKNWLMLMILDEWLRIVLSDTWTDATMVVSLTSQGRLNQLKIQITQPPRFKLTAAATELDYLNQTFRFLMPGHCFQRRSHQTMLWYFCWKI